jgi:MFS family permease
MSTTPRKRPRWYIVVAVGWFALSFAVLGLMFVLDTTGVLRNTNRDAYVHIIGISLLTLVALAFAWTCWVVPVLSATDIPLRTKLPPSHRRSSLLMFTLAPGVALLALAVPFGYMHLRDRDWMWTWSTEQRRIAVVFAISVAMIAIGAFVGRLAIRRLRRASAQHRICYTCGYDLRATPTGDCPECGFHTQLPAPTQS